MMKANLKVILSVVGVAALLASPAIAKQVRPAKLSAFPSDARASVVPYGLNEGGPYTPSIPATRYNTNRDFQNGSRG
jgi:DMSO/TMAO reductase YedYZ molybdopterin-dependent catalytic subunit